MDDDRDYGEAVRYGFRRAMLHWIRASYEVIAGVGALLDEVASVRRRASNDDDQPDAEDGPVKIDLD